MIPSHFPVATSDMATIAPEILSVHARNSKTTICIPGLYPNGSKVVLGRNTRTQELCWLAKQTMPLGSTVSFVCPPKHVQGSPTSWLNDCTDGMYIKPCTSHDECVLVPLVDDCATTLSTGSRGVAALFGCNRGKGENVRLVVASDFILLEQDGGTTLEHKLVLGIAKSKILVMDEITCECAMMTRITASEIPPKPDFAPATNPQVSLNTEARVAAHSKSTTTYRVKVYGPKPPLQSNKSKPSNLNPPSVVIKTTLSTRPTPNGLKDAMAKIGTSMIAPENWFSFPPLPNPKNQFIGSDKYSRTRALQFVENAVELTRSPSVHELIREGIRIQTMDATTDKIPFPDFGGELWSAPYSNIAPPNSESPKQPLLLLRVSVVDYVELFNPVLLPPSTVTLQQCIGFIPAGRRTEVILFSVPTIIIVLSGDIKFAWTTSAQYDEGPLKGRHSNVAELVHVTCDRDFHFVLHGRSGMGLYIRSGTCLQIRANEASTLLAVAQNETAHGICVKKHGNAKGECLLCRIHIQC